MQPLDDRRQALLAAKLGRFADWREPELLPTIGPSDPSAFREFHAAVQSVKETCVDRLLSYRDDQIHSLASDDAHDTHELGEDWNRFATSEIRQLERNNPPWFAGGFGHPDYQADFEYWARMRHFSISEITCLSVGVTPEAFSQDRLDKLARQKSETPWPAIHFLRQRYEQLVRQFGQNSSVSAERFSLWAIRVELEMPTQFLDLLKRYHITSHTDIAKQTEPKREDKREIDKVAQLLVAMAIDGYGYDPDAKRSILPREIADAAATFGIDIHTDTIRKYLRIGAGYLSQDWRQSRD